MSKTNAITAAEFEESVRRHAKCTLARTWETLSPHGRFEAVSLAARDRAIERMLVTEQRQQEESSKQVHYLSMEFLMGQSLGNALLNLEMTDVAREAVANMGGSLDDVLAAEPDAALGNGGLGRLAACYLDSMATLDVAGFGHGINYEFGIFRQEIVNGEQREHPDNWLTQPTPWEIDRADGAFYIPVYGRLDHSETMSGEYNPMWLDWQVLVGVPVDMPIIGYGGETVNVLRLYSARASADFDMQIFNTGDYVRAVQDKVHSETISKVLYPSDAIDAGKELRLLQEYFLVGCAVRDVFRRFDSLSEDITKFPELMSLQLNDTHPALAVAELMRTLIDERDLDWDQAWDITTQTCNYTNHTLLPEALERWPVSLMERLVPRHLQLILEINSRFLSEVEQNFPGDSDRVQRMSIIDEEHGRNVRMAHLSIVGSSKVNGVSALHSELVREELVRDFYQHSPEKFINVTNGVTQRRWLALSNPDLSDVITNSIGSDWITNLDSLRGLESFADDASFQDDFVDAKRKNKQKLAAILSQVARVDVDTESIFDVQAKRIHEYKRQLLNVLNIVYEYLRITEDGWTPSHAKTYLFAGKAAPGYWAAKQIIKLINNVASVVNKDPRTRDWIKVVFVPDYRVSVAERLIPAADISEQISTAGMEASGTGNMKFAINGALTVGTLDGANVEMLEEIGEENIFIFGLRSHEVSAHRRNGTYRSAEVYHSCSAARRTMDAIRDGVFSPKNPGEFQWIFNALVDQGDFYFHLADLESYSTTQGSLTELFVDQKNWVQKSILNVARMGKFSSDRSVRDYLDLVWDRPVSTSTQSSLVGS